MTGASDRTGTCRAARMAVAFALGLLVALGPQGRAEAKYASFVMDASTGRTLHDINADTRNYPASLTKVMTLYLVFDALETGKLTLNQRLKVSAKATRQPPSRLGLGRGETISVRNAILALATKSANDIAVVVAEALGRTERKFALIMTAKARELGMTRTTFRNASGLPHRGQLSTARDMAKLAMAMRRDFPQYYHYFSKTAFTFRGKTYRSHNKMLKTYEGTDGLKTGYIRASGYNLVTSAERGGRRLVGVVFGAKSSRQRNRHMATLLNKGFDKLGTGPTTMASSALATPKTPPKRSKARSKTAGVWGIQVGAYYRFGPAFEAARNAVSRLPNLLAEGSIKVTELKKKRRVLFRARIVDLSRRQAYRACRLLEKSKVPCMELRLPGKALQVASAEGR